MNRMRETPAVAGSARRAYPLTMTTHHPKTLPRDPVQRAIAIARIATGEDECEEKDAGKDPAAVERGRKGGERGGKARASTMTAAERSEAAKKAAAARWEKR